MLAPKTLLLAWLKVRANKGARYLPAFGGTGVDGQSALTEAGQPNLRFAAKAELWAGAKKRAAQAEQRNCNEKNKQVAI